MDEPATVSCHVLLKILDDVSAAKAAKRLIIALVHKDGVPAETLSERCDISRSAVYYWLDYSEELPLNEATEDDDRLGRSTALTAEGCDVLKADLE